MSSVDPVIHPPARLRLTAMLSAVDELEFAKARDALGVSDSVLSKHIAALAAAGYVKVKKTSLAGRRTTRVALTGHGRSAYAAHVTALRAVIDGPQPQEPAGAQGAQRAQAHTSSS